MSVGARVATCRAGGGSAAAFLSFEIGAVRGDEFLPILKLNDIVLRQRDDGEYWLAFPAKQRMKNGQPVKNDAGRPIYDDFITPVFVKDGMKWRITESSERFKNYMLEMAVAAFEELDQEAEGRGSARRSGYDDTPAPAPASRSAAKGGTATARKRVASPAETRLVDEADDELPF